MELKTGYKQTEIGVIPSDWEVKTIAEVVEVDPDNLGSSTNSEYEFNYISLEDVDYGTLRNISEIVFKNAPSRARRKVKKNDILISTVRPNLKSHLLITNDVFDWVCSTGFSVLRCKSETNSAFLFNHFFASIINRQIENLITGSNYPAINSKEVKALQIPIPPTLTEQTLIATALSDADALISSLEKLIAKKRNIKQGAMQKLLQPKEGWEVKKLGEIATVVRGASPRPIEDPKWFDENSSIGWVRISDVTKSVKILTETTQKLSELGIQSSRYVEEGNLIMSICATVGRPILTKINVCIHDGFVVFRNPQVEINYLYYFLSFMEKDWSKNGQTGSQMNLNTTLINTTEIPVPPNKAEQTRIATILSDMDAEIDALETKLEKYKKVKLGMMQNLLTGKIRLV